MLNYSLNHDVSRPSVPTSALMHMASFTELDSLQDTFNEAINAFKLELAKEQMPPLSTYATEPHPLDEPSYLPPPRLYEARRVALACLGQLKTLLQKPYEKVVEQTLAAYDSATLDIVVRTGVIDKLAEEPFLRNGLHISELQRAVDIDSLKLNTVLRYLAAQGWMHEKAESVFALNRPALELRKGSYGRSWALTPGKMKVASSLLDAVARPDWKYSFSPSHTAFQLSHSTPLTLFDYLRANPGELAQWSSSVRSYGDTCAPALLQDYPWAKHDHGTIIDCGGGQGNLTLALSRILPSAAFVIQDLPEVVISAEANVAREYPEALRTGRIKIQAHDLFTYQPAVTGNATYIFRYIFHDWADSACVDMLRNIPARDQVKILIIEYVSQPATINSGERRAESLVASQRPNDQNIYSPTPAPSFIPDNFGVGAKMSLGLGVHLLGVYNARERSLTEWQSIIEKAGLKLAAYYPLRAHISVMECEPVLRSLRSNL